MSAELIRLQADDVGIWWPWFGRLVEPAIIRTNKATLEDLHCLAVRDQVQCWAVWDPEAKQALAGVVTELREYPARRVAQVLWCAGEESSRWLHLIATLETWAREEGCASIEVVGRRGWQRLLHEYAPIETVLSKEL